MARAIRISGRGEGEEVIRADKAGFGLVVELRLGEGEWTAIGGGRVS